MHCLKDPQCSLAAGVISGIGKGVIGRIVIFSCYAGVLNALQLLRPGCS